jgi:hypothetical protein
VLARNPRFTIGVVSTIGKLDQEGFIHNVAIGGMTLARMEHTFRETAGGMIDENCLIIPGSHRLAFLSRVLVLWTFPEPEGQAWLKHGVDEMERSRTSSRTSTPAKRKSSGAPDGRLAPSRRHVMAAILRR